MDDLADRFADRGVTSAFLYTREAHPGENWRHHSTMDDKRRGARGLRDLAKVRRPILLDDLQGTAHAAWGRLPNMTWIIGRGGMILYKAMWTDAGDVEHALIDVLEHLPRRKEDKLAAFYSERIGWRTRDDARFREGLQHAGPQAVADFYRKPE